MAFNLRRAVREGKALTPHYGFMDPNTPVSTYAPGLPVQPGNTKSLISQRNASMHMDAYGGRQAIDHVFDAIGLYADPTATAEYRLTDMKGLKLVRDKTPGTPPEYKVGPADLYDLLDKPNPFMLYDEMMTLLVIDLFLVGNAYWMKWNMDAAGKPVALYRLCPSHVKIIPGPYGVEGYSYQPPGVRDPMLISPERLIHFRRPNPNDPYYGIGIIQGGGRAMDLELAITNTTASYYENKADPSLIIQSERRVPRDVFNKLRAQLRARTSGPNKTGELLVLESGLKASTLSADAQTALFNEISVMSRGRMLAKFRAHAKLLGLDDQSASSDKISDIRAEFTNESLRPFLTRLSTMISASLAEMWEVKYIIEHRSILPVADALAVVAEIAVVPGIKIREIRRQLAQFGIDESTGDDSIDNMIINDPTLDMNNSGQVTDPKTGQTVPNQGADQPIGKEPGRPPLISNTRAMGVASGKSLQDTIAILEAKGLEASPKAILAARSGRPFVTQNVSFTRPVGELLEALEAKAMTLPSFSHEFSGLLTGENRPPDPHEAARTADLNATVDYIHDNLAAAATELERGLLDHVEGKALKTSDIVGRISNSQAWKKFSARVEEVLMEAARRSASSSVVHSGLAPEEGVDYDALAKNIVNRDGGLRSILKTLKQRAVNAIKDTRSADGERVDYTNAVREVIHTWSTNQARTIAETEAVHAYNEATLTAAELSGMTHVFVTDGNDTDQPCIDADGSVWEIDHARANRLEHPNCRRAFIPLDGEVESVNA